MFVFCTMIDLNFFHVCITMSKREMIQPARRGLDPTPTTRPSKSFPSGLWPPKNYSPLYS